MDFHDPNESGLRTFYCVFILIYTAGLLMNTVYINKIHNKYIVK